MLVERWRKARERDLNDPAYGMIPGYHEADINFLTPNVYELNYDRPYLSNTGEIWRGLRDLAGAYAAMGAVGSEPSLTARGESLKQIVEDMFVDAQRGVERSWLVKDGVEGLPIIAGDKTFYWEHPYRSRPESYDENRVWSELFFGGAATKQTVQRLWDMAGERGHTTLGVFNNRKSLVGFLVWEEIAGLLQHDMVPQALLTFYAQALHAHSRGTWTAIECVDMDRTRGAHSPYCLPAQMTVPIVAKWLLVYEDPVSGAIILCHGLPRDFLADGRSLCVEGAPTRRGKLGFQLNSQISKGVISVQVRLPERAGGCIILRLRAPLGHRLASAEIVGATPTALAIETERVVLPKDAIGVIDLVTQWTEE